MERKSKYLSIIISALLILFIVFSCDEKTYVKEQDNNQIPEVTSFEPLTANVGENLSIRGGNLNYAKKVFIGNEEVEIKNKVSNSLLIVKIGTNITGGKVLVHNSDSAGIESIESFTVLFGEPVLEIVPEGGYINENVVISGSNLQYIYKILIGDTEAEIVSQSTDQLVFTVPYYLANQATLTYEFVAALGSSQVSLTEDGFSVYKSMPALTTVPSKAMINSEITIIGENLNVVDSVYFADYKVEPSSQDALTITFTIPNDTLLEGYQEVKLYSYGGQELSSGAVLRVITKFEWIVEDFESFDGDPFTLIKEIQPLYQTGLNLGADITAPDGNYYASMKIDYDQSIIDNGGSTYTQYRYNGDGGLIDLSEFDDPWVHFWINTNNTEPYFVFYCDLSESVEEVTKDRGTHYVKRFNSADYGEGWQLFAWRMKNLKFRSGGSADPYPSDIFSIYNLKSFRIQLRTSSDIPLETSEFHFDSFIFVNGKLSGAHDVTTIGGNE